MSLAVSTRDLMREIRALMAEPGGAQARLDRFAEIIARNLLADVCAIYLRRAGGQLELCATTGLAAAAVHATRLRPGEGLVGRVAAEARPLVTRDAPSHPGFSYRPETGEDALATFLGVPILRGGRLLGVLTVQSRTARDHADDEVETLQTVAMILAEVVADPALAEGPALSGIELRPVRPERLAGRAAADGVGVGVALKHEPHVPSTRLISEDPEHECARLEDAMGRMRARFDAVLSDRLRDLVGASREVMESFRMFAHDPAWLGRLQEAARSGLTAEAAVERVRNEHRARLLKARDPYLRERLHDLEDLADRMLRHLAEETGEKGLFGRQDGVGAPVLVARAIGPAELLDRAASGLQGVVTEEGGPASHAAIVAKALGVAMVARVIGVLERVETGDAVIVDGGRGEVHLRPTEETRRAYAAKIASRGRARAEFDRLRGVPAVTRDGRRVNLMLNAGLTVDLPQLDKTGADGIGLFRTEFQFMVADTLPRQAEQAALYGAALEAAGDRPVTFRTLDLGGDKTLTYADAEREENPAMGWRAVRMALDRKGLMRYQLRALLTAAAGRPLRVMFPFIATPAEFRLARDLVRAEEAWAVRHGRARPSEIHVGAMIETPASALHADALLSEADFVSVGANDLMQFVFAADRGNARVADRYDLLSTPMLRLLSMIADAARRLGKSASVCGEAAGRPLEAMALVALGFDTLSMPPSGVGPVKQAILAMDAGRVQQRLGTALAGGVESARADLEALMRADPSPG